MSLPTATDLPTRRHRLVDLLLVLAVAFLQPVTYSIYVLLAHAHPYEHGSNILGYYIQGFSSETTALALLVVLLKRQGRSLESIGLRFAWKDIGRTIFVLFASGIVTVAFEWFLYYVFMRMHVPISATANTEFVRDARAGGLFLLAVPFAILNPFYEELIVRAYLTTELQYLSGRTWIGVVASVLLQVSYHLYQGVFRAVTYTALFFIFSLYYVWTRRITPVVFSHMFYDITALLWY